MLFDYVLKHYDYGIMKAQFKTTCIIFHKNNKIYCIVVARHQTALTEKHPVHFF